MGYGSGIVAAVGQFRAPAGNCQVPRKDAGWLLSGRQSVSGQEAAILDPRRWNTPRLGARPEPRSRGPEHPDGARFLTSGPGAQSWTHLP